MVRRRPASQTAMIRTVRPQARRPVATAPPADTRRVRLRAFGASSRQVSVRRRTDDPPSVCACTFYLVFKEPDLRPPSSRPPESHALCRPTVVRGTFQYYRRLRFLSTPCPPFSVEPPNCRGRGGRAEEPGWERRNDKKCSENFPEHFRRLAPGHASNSLNIRIAEAGVNLVRRASEKIDYRSAMRIRTRC